MIATCIATTARKERVKISFIPARRFRILRVNA